MRQRPGEAGGSAGGARVRRAPGDPLAGDVVLGATCIGGARPAWGSVKRWGSACPRSSCAGCAAALPFCSIVVLQPVFEQSLHACRLLSAPRSPPTCQHKILMYQDCNPDALCSQVSSWAELRAYMRTGWCMLTSAACSVLRYRYCTVPYYSTAVATAAAAAEQTVFAGHSADISRSALRKSFGQPIKTRESGARPVLGVF
jgi:hypothetical protein